MKSVYVDLPITELRKKLNRELLDLQDRLEDHCHMPPLSNNKRILSDGCYWVRSHGGSQQ